MTAPLGTTLFIIQFLGWYWLIGGIFAIVGIFLDSSQWGWKPVSGILGILGALSILFDLLLLIRPFAAALSLPWVFAVFAIVGGIAAIVMAFRMK